MLSKTGQSGARNWSRIALPILILLLALWLRAGLIWTSSPFDVDEALYASFARQISHENNPLLLGLAVDKPPLAFYLTALTFKLFTSPSEWAARLPNLAASLISLPALWALARRLYRDERIAALAMLFLALSPLDAALAATAFTDPQANLWILLATLTIVRGRWHWSGMLAGLAFCTKQSALQLLPLILLIGAITNPLSARRGLLRFAAAFVAIGALPFLWDGLRGSDTVGWWALGAAYNAPDRLIRSDEVLPRLLDWLEHLAGGAGGPAALAVLAAGGAFWLGYGIRQHPRQRETGLDIALAAYVLACLAIYWLAAFNIYNRYVLPLLPLFGLLFARALIRLGDALLPHRRSRSGALAAGLLLMLVAPAAAGVRQGITPLRPAQDSYQGIAEAAAYLNALPPGTIVYDHWLGWPLGWYTGQNRPRDMWLRITYYPVPEALIRDALRESSPEPRYLVTPDWAPAAPWLSALSSAGMRPAEVARRGHFIIYKLESP